MAAGDVWKKALVLLFHFRTIRTEGMNESNTSSFFNDGENNGELAAPGGSSDAGYRFVPCCTHRGFCTIITVTPAISPYHLPPERRIIIR